jgi:transposase-like protein
MVLEDELKAMVGARRFERVGSRTDHRNGTFLRRTAKRLDEVVDNLRKRPIESGHSFPYLDATFLDSRWAREDLGTPSTEARQKLRLRTVSPESYFR